jgi:hypothetical protein
MKANGEHMYISEGNADVAQAIKSTSKTETLPLLRSYLANTLISTIGIGIGASFVRIGIGNNQICMLGGAMSMMTGIAVLLSDNIIDARKLANALVRDATLLRALKRQQKDPAHTHITYREHFDEVDGPRTGICIKAFSLTDPKEAELIHQAPSYIRIAAIVGTIGLSALSGYLGWQFHDHLTPADSDRPAIETTTR